MVATISGTASPNVITTADISAVPTSNPSTGNNRVLALNVPPWLDYGFGVFAFADCVGTQCRPIAHLVDEIGKAQLMIMTGVDAQRWQPPSKDTAFKIAQMCNRVQYVLSTRMKLQNQGRLSIGKAGQSPMMFNIHPVPYFNGPLVVNPWMSEWNDLIMIALTNMVQHSDNNLGLTITQQFASEIMPYFKEIALKLGTEMLGMDVAKIMDPAFTFNLAGGVTGMQNDFSSYSPMDNVPNLELVSGAGPLFSMPTMQDMVELTRGVAANLIAPLLRQYPVGPVPGTQTVAGSPLLATQALLASSSTGPASVANAANAIQLAIAASLGAPQADGGQVAAPVDHPTGTTSQGSPVIPPAA